MNDIKMKTIFNQRMCGYLMMKGFVLAAMRPNEDGSGKNVFYFKKSEELLSAMNEYMTIRNENISSLIKITM